MSTNDKLNQQIDNVGQNLKPEHLNPRQLKVKHKDGEEVPFEKYFTSFKNELHKVEPDKDRKVLNLKFRSS